MSQDHSRANLCCTRPSPSTSELSSDNVPRTIVYDQINGSSSKIDRIQLSRSASLLSPALGSGLTGEQFYRDPLEETALMERHHTLSTPSACKASPTT